MEVVTYTLQGPTDDGQKYSHMSLAVLALDASFYFATTSYMVMDIQRQL